MSSDEFSFKAFSEHAFYRKVNEALVDHAQLKRGWTVVDVACGSGAITELIIDKIRGARNAMVIGVDMSTTALREAADKVADARDAVVEFVQTRAEEMSASVKRAVDAVVFCNGIHYIEDKQVLLEEVHRTLKPGGVFAFNTGFFDGALPPETLKYYRRWMMKSLRRLKKQYNLKPQHSKVEARKQLTADEYRALLEAEGFEIKFQAIYPGEVTEQGWIDLSRFSDFIAGALPGIPLATASDVLVESLRETFEEFNLTVWPRNWLTVVAARH
ncbi:MAG: methyltransferase domain-containing protein [Gemmatimonadales bacterium]|jgi:ubiquinone/menaquinone biosynthesis C-methylase UbiE